MMPSGLFDDPVLQTLFFILFIGMTIYIFMQTSRQTKKKEPPRKIFTIIQCTATGEEEKRDYREGDFVGKEIEECGGNGSPGVKIVKAIYAEKIELTRRKQA